ncbi:rCG44043 [Rattus norvegicus]|uniref:RCG44043 n=1 Tax=Rattus norvegicus TaxID=10116 RepID=A6J783_RAT|nr:rCG44043 [Rattus norvegicus]
MRSVLRRVTAAAPGVQLLVPHTLTPTTTATICLRPGPILLEILIPFATNRNHQTRTSKVTPGFLPNWRSPPLTAVTPSGCSALGVLLALSFPPLPPGWRFCQPTPVARLGFADLLIATCKIKVVP